MMLTKIEKLVVEDIRIFSGRHEYDFEKGITLIHGDNGKGKSTLGTMVMLTLIHPAKSDKLKKQLVPKRGGSPKSSVTFSTDNGRFTISKVWGEKDQTKLTNADTNELLSQGSQASEMASQLAYNLEPKSKNYQTRNGPSQNLWEMSKAELPSIAFHLQGELFNSLDMGENLRRIGLAVDEAELAKLLNKIEIGSEEERSKYISSLKADGTPRSGASGAVIELQNERIELENKISEAKDVESELSEAEDALYENHERESEVSEESRDETREQIRLIRTQIDEQRNQREAAHGAYEQQRSLVEPIQNAHKERIDLLERKEAVEESVKAETAKHKEKAKKFEYANDDFTTEAEVLKTGKDEFQRVSEWEQFEGSKEQAERNREQLNNLKKQRDQRIEKESEIAAWSKEINEIQIASNEQFEELRLLDEKIAVARSERAMNINILKPVKDTVIRGDGAEIDASGMASEKIEIVRNGDVVIEIDQAMSGDSPSELELKKLEILHSLGVESRSELIRRRDRKQELEVKVATTQEFLSGMPETSILDEQITSLQIELRQEVSRPEDERPEGKLADLLVRIKERVRLSQERLEEVRKLKEQAHTALELVSNDLRKATDKLANIENELNEHRLEQGSDEDLSELHATSGQKLAELKVVYDELFKNKPLLEDAQADRANKLQDSLDEYDEKRALILQLEERVIQLRTNALLSDLPDLEAKLVTLDAKIEQAQFDHDAYAVLSMAAQQAKMNAQTQSRSEIKERLDYLLGYVWGSQTSIHFDDDGKPVSAEQIDVSDESHGTKEQLQAVMRMILLSLASEGRGTAMILDDAFVFADPGRLNRMKDVIRLFARDDNLQFIILSCDGQDYVDLADRRIELE